ncbi:MAG: hypothetical protein ACJA0T_001698 [Colwellia sp.]|jgi:hypothetical protein
MLKLVKTTMLLVTTSLTFSTIAIADPSSDLANICTIVKADDKGELRKKMKKVQADYKLKLPDYYSGISCGGLSLIRFAFSNDAEAVGKLMIKKMPKSILIAPEADGKTLRAWVSDSDFMEKPLAKALNKRI